MSDQQTSEICFTVIVGLIIAAVAIYQLFSLRAWERIEIERIRQKQKGEGK